jgi:gas vesicle protein
MKRHFFAGIVLGFAVGFIVASLAAPIWNIHSLLLASPKESLAKYAGKSIATGAYLMWSRIEKIEGSGNSRAAFAFQPSQSKNVMSNCPDGYEIKELKDTISWDFSMEGKRSDARACIRDFRTAEAFAQVVLLDDLIILYIAR